jgi:hypothetical protein
MNKNGKIKTSGKNTMKRARGGKGRFRKKGVSAISGPSLIQVGAGALQCGLPDGHYPLNGCPGSHPGNSIMVFANTSTPTQASMTWVPLGMTTLG